MRRLTAYTAAAVFVFTVWFANWLVNHYGPIRVWPTELRAPAGVYVVGVAFLLRDTVQRFEGQVLALAAIALGTALSITISPKLALASGVAFAASELAGLALFWSLGGNTGGKRRLALAVIVASLIAAALDSFLFLWISGFGVHAYFTGQFVAKVSVLALAVPFVLAARRLTTPSPRLGLA